MCASSGHPLGFEADAGGGSSSRRAYEAGAEAGRQATVFDGNAPMAPGPARLRREVTRASLGCRLLWNALGARMMIPGM